MNKSRKNNIKIIRKNTGWDDEKIIRKLTIAKDKYGIKSFRYTLNEFWKLEDKEMEETNKKIEEYMKKNKYQLSVIKEKDHVLKEVIAARKIVSDKYGINSDDFYEQKLYKMSSRKFNKFIKMKKLSFDRKELLKEFKITKQTYERKHLDLLSDNEFKRYIKALEQIRNNEKRDDEFYINLAMDRTNLSKDKLLKDMEKCEEIGIKKKKYVQKGAYNLNEKERIELSEFLKEDRKRIIRESWGFIDGICKKTGWPIQKVELMQKEAKARCGCSYEDYLAFEFWNVSPQKQKTYATLQKYDKVRIKFDEFFSTRNNFDNKSNFNIVFKDYIKRVWFTNENLTYEKFIKYIKGLKKIIVKPLSSTCGIGITTYECNKSEEDNKKIYNKLVSLDKSIIEEYIVQNKELTEFCRTSVNTVRVYTVYDKGVCDIVYAFLRMGNGGPVDNFHADGLAANINVETGIVDSNAVNVNNEVYKNSPATGKKIKGFEIPYWKEIVELSKELSKIVPDSKAIGWDFAITENGIDIIEGNTGAYFVYQLIKVQTKTGIAKNLIDKYL